MANNTIHEAFNQAVYYQKWDELFQYFNTILQNPNNYLQELKIYLANTHNIKYYLHNVAKNNKKRINTLLQYHAQCFEFLPENEKKKGHAILSEIYLNYPHIKPDYFYLDSLDKKETLHQFFKSVSKQGKVIFDKIKKEQDINFFINQNHEYHHYSLKEALISYLFTYEKPKFRKLSQISKELWDILPDSDYPIDFKKIQEKLNPSIVRLYNFQNFPLPYKNEFNELVDIIIFKNTHTTTYKNAIFWNEFLVGIQEVFQLNTTNRTPNHQEVKTMIDLVKSYYHNNFVQEVFPFFAKEKAKNARTEKNKSLWQACLLELSIEEKKTIHKTVKI